MDEAPGSVTVTLGSGTGYSLGDPASASVTIKDNDPAPVVTLSLSPPAIGEDGGESAVTARLDRPSSAETTVRVSSSGPSWAYTQSGDTLTIAAGSTSSTGDVSIEAAGDTDDDPNRTVTVSGTASNAQGAKGPADIKLTIRDDDPAPTVTLKLSPSSIAEGGSSTVTASLSHGSSQATTVTVSASGPAGGYTLSGTELTIARWKTASTGTVTIRAADDDVDGPDKSVAVSGEASNAWGVAGDPSDRTLTIRDDDSTPTVTLTLTPSSIGEDGGQSAVTASLSHPSSAATTLTVSVAPVPPAVAGDFELSANRTLAIEAGATASTGAVTVTGVDNGVDAADKSVTVSAAASGGNGVAAPSSRTLTLEDDDVTVSFSSAAHTAAEGGAAATVTVNLGEAPGRQVAIPIVATGTGGAAPGDYALSAATLTFGAGDTEKAFTVTAVEDAVDDDGEGVSLSFGTLPAGVTAGGQATAAVSLVDNDVPALTISADAPSVTEGASAGFTVTASPAPGRNLTVSIGVTGAGDRIGGTPPSSVTLGAGATSAPLSIATVDDSVDGADGDIEVTLKGGTGYALGSATSASVTVRDDDTRGVTVSTTAVTVSEASGTATYTVTLNSHPTADVTITPEIDDAAAATVSPASLTFGASDWNTVRTVTVTGVDDAIDNAGNRRGAEISHAASGGDYDGVVVGGVDVTVTDDDEPVVGISAGASPVTEGTDASFTVTVSPVSAADLTVAIDVTDGGGYVDGAKPTGVTLAAGQSTKALSIATEDDFVDEADADIKVTLNEGVGYALDTGNASASVRVEDDDTAGLVFTPSALAVTEGSTATYTVKLATEPTGDVGVAIGSDNPDVTVDADPDRPGDQSTLSFTASDWGVARTVAVAAVHDADAAADTAVLGHDATGGGYDGVDADVTVHVAEDAMPGFGDRTVADRVWTATHAIAPLTLPEASGGDGALAYSLEPALPVGLSFAASSRQISGTPLAAAAHAVYTYTATDADGDGASLTFAIAVEADSAPSFGTETVADRVWSSGLPISALELPGATGGNGALTYTLTPALPAGLGFDAANRRISGTPSTAQSETLYTYTVADRDGDGASLSFAIAVEADSVPDFADAAVADQSYKKGSPIPALMLPAAAGGNGALTYTLTPALPSGLTFDAGARRVSGTPTEASARTQYTLTATDRDGQSGALSFHVEAVEPQPFDPSVAPGDFRAEPGDGAVSLSWEAVPGATGYELLHGRVHGPGLSRLDVGAVLGHKVSGLRTGALYVYQVRAYAEAADGTRLFGAYAKATATPVDLAPAFGTETVADQAWSAGLAVPALRLPEASGGNGALTYALSPALPAGLSFDAGTRQITGTPAAPAALATYTYTAADGDGDEAALTFGIAVEADSVPDFADAAVADQAYKKDSPIPALTLPAAAGGNGALTYALTPALPAGLVFDAGARGISGTPTEVMAQTQYTLTATDRDGQSAALEFHIEVKAAQPFDSKARPGGLSGEPGDGSVTLSWEAVAGATGYELRHRRAGPSYPFVPRHDVGNVSSHTVHGLENGKLREFRLRAVSERDGDRQVGRETRVTLMPKAPESALGVADAGAKEGVDALLEFAVTLSPPAAETVTVKYATSDGSATAGEDYQAAHGVLTFKAGETGKTVAVAVLDDAKDEGEETFTLVLSNAAGASIQDGTATGTIENADPMPGAWLGRFGHTVAGQVIDAVGARLEGRIGPPATFGGRDGGTPDGTPGGHARHADMAPQERRALRPGPSDWRRDGRVSGHGFGTRSAGAPGSPGFGPQGVGTSVYGTQAFGARPASARDFVMGRSFHLGLLDDAAPADAPDGSPLALWGRFTAGRFDGEAGGARMDGEVATGLVAGDVSRGRWLAGAALSYSEGAGGFALDTDTAAAFDRGRIDTALTGVFPYGRYRLNGRVDVWALAGLGAGALTLTEESGADANRYTADTEMRLGAFGVRGVLLQAPSGGGFELAVKSDAFLLRMDSGRVPGMEDSVARTDRVRLLLQTAYNRKLGGGTLTPRLEAGLSRDGGDAGSGTGVEVGAGLRYAGARVSLEGSLRGRVARGTSSGGGQWGAGVSVRVAPGTSGRGLSLTLSPSWGDAPSGVGRLWSDGAAAFANQSSFHAGRRVESELGYGFEGPRGRGTFTPFAGLSLAGEHGRTWKTGMRWKAGTDSFLDLETTRREAADGRAPDRGFRVTGNVRW